MSSFEAWHARIASDLRETFRPADGGRDFPGLKLSSKKTPLPPALFDGDFEEAHLGCGKLLSNFPLELAGEVFGNQFRARVDDGKKNDVSPRQDDPLILVEHLEVGAVLENPKQRTLLWDERAVVQLVAGFFYQGLEGNEVQHDPCPVQFSFHGDGDLIVMPMERLSPSIGEDEEMG